MVVGSCIMLYALFQPEKKHTNEHRPNGHYAVKIAGRWTVGELRDKNWTIIGNECTYETHEFDAINNIEIFYALNKIENI